MFRGLRIIATLVVQIVYARPVKQVGVHNDHALEDYVLSCREAQMWVWFEGARKKTDDNVQQFEKW